jgi:site-specific recombinase XerD
VAAADHEIVEPSDDPEGDAAVIQWERKCAAETVKYFETEHDKVVADSEADTKPVDIHRAVLRHSFASLAADLGLADSTIAGLIGHKQQSITSRYLHLDKTLVTATNIVAAETLQLMRC